MLWAADDCSQPNLTQPFYRTWTGFFDLTGPIFLGEKTRLVGSQDLFVTQ